MPHLPHKQAAHLRRPVLLFAFVIVGGLAAAEPKDTHHVKAVRFWSLGEITRIAVETDGDFQVRSDRLENPDRLFFDLVGTLPRLSDQRTTVIPVSDRLVKQIRVAETQRNVTRVVLDMESPAVATTSHLDNPNRLIIELRSSSAQAAPKKPAVDTMVVEVGPASAPREVPRPRELAKEVTAREIASAEMIAPKPVGHRQFSPPPPAPAAPPKPVQVALLDPPKVAAPQPKPAITSSLVAKLAPSTSSNSSFAAPPPKPVEPAPALATTTPPASGTTPISTTAAPLPAKRNSMGGRSMIRVLGLKVGRIVLDPGHGGYDTGTVGPEGLREKDLVLDVAKRLGALIEDRLGSEVIYTRSDDSFVQLERRTEIANEAKADLFLSIHANSSTLRSAAGVETYYLNFTTSRAALEVAARENAGSQKTIYELQDLLEKIALKDKVEESREFATRVQSSLFTLSAKSDALSRDHRGVKRAPFVVLIGASMPSVLSEIGFISNAHDESIMKRAEYRQRIAEALYKGVASYAGTLSHFQVAQRE